MDFTSLLPLAGAVLGGSASGSSQQTQSKDPWSAAQPWMQSNLGLGQNLQSQYAANPFSQSQIQAYGNAANTNSQIRNGANSIISQLSNIPSFDRTNPLNKPATLDLSGALSTAGTGNTGFSGSTASGVMPAQAQSQYAPIVQQMMQMGRNGGGNLGLGGPTSYNTTPLTGISALAGYLGNLGFTGISDALAASNGTNYGNEGRNSSAPFGYGGLGSMPSQSPDSLSDSQREALGAAMGGWGSGGMAG